MVWGNAVDAPAACKTARMVGSTVPLIAILYVTAGFIRRAKRLSPHSRSASQRIDSSGPFRLFDIISFLIFGTAVLLASLLSTPLLQVAITLFSPVRIRVQHALSWTNRQEDRQLIERAVQGSLAYPSARRVVIAHSQGASISVELAKKGAFDSKDRIITLGSGHGVLGALRSLETRGRSIWGLTVLVTVYFSLFSLSLVLPLLVAVQVLFLSVNIVISLGTALYAFPYPTVSLLAYEDIAYGLEVIITTISSMPVFSPFSLLVSIVGTIISLACARWIYNLFSQATEPSNEADLLQEGLDLVASHDPVSATIAATGGRRVLEVQQTCSLTLDHTSYFSNSFVLETIGTEILSAIRGETIRGQGWMRSDPWRDRVRRLRFQRSQLAIGSAIMFSMSSLAVANVPIAVTLALAIAGSWLGYILGTSRLLRFSQVKRSRIKISIPARSCKRIRFALTAFGTFLTVPLLGSLHAIALNGRVVAPEWSPDDAGLFLSPLALFLGVGIAVSLANAAAGSSIALALSGLSLASASSVWVIRGEMFWAFASLYFFLGMACLLVGLNEYIKQHD